jgi:hypothetical protein
MAGRGKGAKKPAKGGTARRTSPRARVEQAKRDAFLAAFAQTGVVLTAAELAGIGRRTHYNWLDEDPEYEARFRDAEEAAADLLEKEARRRAIDGTLKPVYQGGILVGHIQEYSDTLLTFLLSGRRKTVFSKRSEITGADGEPLIPQDLSETRILTALGGLLHLRELEGDGEEEAPLPN